MTWIIEATSQPIAVEVSLVLLNFLWQGCLAAGIASVALIAVPRRSASLRYAIACAGLLAMVVLPPLWFACGNESLGLSTATSQSETIGFFTTEAGTYGTDDFAIDLPVTEPVTTTVDDVSLIKWLRLALLCTWLSGQSFLACRLVFGACLVWQIRNSAIEVSTKVRQATSVLAKRIGVRKIPMILETDRVSDAITCGFFRTCVILPSSWMTQMTPEMLEAVIAHELSHVRRHDLWVNFLQRAVETVFFYHPAVWWLSKQIRIEREHCCDSAAVRATGNAGIFARALEFAARQRVGLRFALVTNLGEDRMSLLNRIQRVLGVPSQFAKPRMDAWSFGLVAIVVPLLFVWNQQQESMAQQTLRSPEHETAIDNYEVSKTNVVQDMPSTATRVDAALQRFDEVLVPTVGNTQAPPTELNKVTLPDYVIEPPDILSVEVVSLIPNDTFPISVGDVFQIHEPNAKEPIAGQYAVEGEGTIQLGAPYGVVPVAGQTLLAAKKKIVKHIAMHVKSPKTNVSFIRIGAEASIVGQFLVGPDGTITLGRYGNVSVSGKTLEETKAAIEKHLGKWSKKPKVSPTVFAYNSKVYYVIVESANQTGDRVIRIPVTGNETVLDAISQLDSIAQVAKGKMWISRPNRKSGKTKRLPIDWNGITRGAATASNYQLLPGDRLFISQRHDGDAEQKVEVKENRGEIDAADRETELAAMVDKFNELMDQQRYSDAYVLAKRAHEMAPNVGCTESMVWKSRFANRLSAEHKHKTDKMYNRTYSVHGILGARFTESNRGTETTRKLDWDGLRQLIETTVSPNSWHTAGGPCRFEAFEANSSLVVQANEEVHDELSVLFQRIRRITKPIETTNQNKGSAKHPQDRDVPKAQTKNRFSKARFTGKIPKAKENYRAAYGDRN